MANKLVDERDQAFILYEQLDIESLSKFEPYREFTRDIYDMVLSEAQKLSLNLMAPSNSKGDDEGCRLVDGKVIVPEPFHELWRKYTEGGWMTISDSPEVGGQGMPLQPIQGLHQGQPV
jgi:alkylation response protein AidB-like acyl-CoA dehydrogenase